MTAHRARWPERDPLAMDGLYWPGGHGHPPQTVSVHHRHIYPDGTVLHARSQWLSVYGRTLDRWILDGRRVGLSCRSSHPTELPDFATTGSRILAIWRHPPGAAGALPRPRRAGPVGTAAEVIARHID